MEAKALFKKLVKDARERNTDTDPRPIMAYGSQRQSDFEVGKRSKGCYSHLTDEYIDGLDDKELEWQMVSFIYTCFRQR